MDNLSDKIYRYVVGEVIHIWFASL